MIEKKPCKVCVFLKIYPDNFVLEVDSLLVSGVTEKKLKELLSKSKVLTHKIPPTFHFFKIHRDNCLVGFVPKVEDVKEVSDSANDNNLQHHLDNYRKMTVQERDVDHIERLKEIKYLSGVVILQELLKGYIVNTCPKRSIPKEDISALKQIEDVVHSLKEDTKLDDLNINVRNVGEDIK